MKLFKTIIAASVIGVIGFAVASNVISIYNSGNVMEKNVVAAYDNNRNILAQYQQKVLEASQVSEIYSDDLKKVVEAAVEGRYGEDGSRAVFQFIQEQNPQVDSSVYLKIQQIIESGRTDFKVGQERLIDTKRVYETQLGYFWTGTVLSMVGYPKIDLNKYNIVTTAHVETTFENKVEETLQLRKK